MRLAQFIESARGEILAESEKYASTLPLLSGETEVAALRDHLPAVLDAIVLDLRQPQSRAESVAKSEGRAPAPVAQSAAQSHGLRRARIGLTVEQLIAEFRVLRSSVLRQWAEAYPPDQHTIEDTLRFNEAIDQAVAESVSFYVTEIERWRALFLGVLGHDLRGPLNAMLLAAEVLDHKAKQTFAAEDTAALIRQGRRLAALLDSLLVYNRAALGIGMVLHRAKVDLAVACRDEVTLLRDALPDTQILFTTDGDTNGVFDASRVREALANLVINAAQHGRSTAPITVSVAEHNGKVEVSSENESEPIPQKVLQSLFEPLRRYADAAGDSHSHLGLGLFIVREIARAHGGDATTSMKNHRISFKMILPKSLPARGPKQHEPPPG